MDLDTHADNTVLGNSCLLIHNTGRKVDVSGISTALGSIELLIVSGAVAYDHPTTGKVYILVFHQAIYCRQMDNHLICPMQCRVNGVVINDTPKMCAPNPDDSTHSIEVADPLGQDATLHITLILRGVASCFCVRKPSTVEFEDEDIPKLNMTYESPKWDPSDPDWAAQEASMTDSRGRVHDLDNVIAGGQRFINLVSTSEQSSSSQNELSFCLIDYMICGARCEDRNACPPTNPVLCKILLIPTKRTHAFKSYCTICPLLSFHFATTLLHPLTPPPPAPLPRVQLRNKGPASPAPPMCSRGGSNRCIAT
jgi:hypothetical protein